MFCVRETHTAGAITLCGSGISARVTNEIRRTCISYFFFSLSLSLSLHANVCEHTVGNDPKVQGKKSQNILLKNVLRLKGYSLNTFSTDWFARREYYILLNQLKHKADLTVSLCHMNFSRYHDCCVRCNTGDVLNEPNTISQMDLTEDSISNKTEY